MTGNIVFKEEPPAAKEYIEMRKNAGWFVYEDLDAVEKGFANSLYHISARKNGKLIAMGRVIGDGSAYFYIQDIIVSEEYQGKGIGTQIMSKIMDYINTAAMDYARVGVFTALNKEPFYEKFSFIARPNKTAGCGMMHIHRRISR